MSMFFNILVLFFLSVTFGCTNDSGAKNIRVVDGDTLEIDGKKYRVDGIDAPEKSQTCKDADGKEWKCGVVAMEYMQSIVNESDIFECISHGTGYYGRELSVCYSDGKDVNSMMVRAGYATDYCVDVKVAYAKSKGKTLDRNIARERCKDKSKYTQDDSYAQENSIGIWAGDFLLPKVYRSQK